MIHNIRYAVSVVAISSIAFFSSATSAGEPDLKEIMQQLRNNLVEITDGLLLDDFDRIAQGAVGIASHPQIAAAQVKRVVAELGPRMPEFKKLDQRVHDLSVSIEAAAKNMDRDTVTAEYQNLISGCLACHTDFKEQVANALGKAP